MPHSLPFISSPDSANTSTPSAPAPGISATPSGHRPAVGYYAPGPTDQQAHALSVAAQHQTPATDLKPVIPLDGVGAGDDPPGVASDPEPYHQPPPPMRPVLETDGVVSAEVGGVPGILHQELHPDGQPRRPMNAFMIFARHRRPAIQAKEPGLKTGEISKRLSHDWKNLPDGDKSHYLEQAKLLKDEFHSRFPEYVYRRRPNNTGKRRSSTSQQQLQSKFACGSAAPQMMTTGVPPPEMHSHPHHHPVHAVHGDMYQTHPHHLSPHAHHHAQLPGRTLTALTSPSAKLPQAHNFYPPPNSTPSPGYRHVGHPLPSSTCGRSQLQTGSYSARGSVALSTNPSAAPGGSSAVASPRPLSPGPSPATASRGLPPPHLCLTDPQPAAHHAQQSSGHYPWFAGEPHSYALTPTAHTHQPHTPLSASRSSFYYSSWPTSATPDSQSMSASDAGGSGATEAPDSAHPISHSRAASYSAAPGLCRPPSPIDRARQLSLPSHAISVSSPVEGAGKAVQGSGPYGRPQAEPHGAQGSLNGSSTTSTAYGAYSSQDVMGGNPRSPYGTTSLPTGYGPGSGRAGLIRHGAQDSNPDYNHSTHHPSQQSHVHGANSGGVEASQAGGYTSHCNTINHHPPPPQPPPANSTSHHQHPAAHSNSARAVAASVAY